jgi:hypothetical protein
MNVSKFGNSGDSDTATTASASTGVGLTISQIANLFLCRDDGNKGNGDIDMSGNKLLNVADPVEASNAANKNYADLKVNTAGDEVIGNLITKF